MRHFFAFFTAGRPSSAMLSSVEVREGDMVVLGTDGFFYNMYDAEVAQILQEMKVLAVGSCAHHIACEFVHVIIQVFQALSGTKKGFSIGGNEKGPIMLQVVLQATLSSLQNHLQCCVLPVPNLEQKQNTIDH